MIIPHPARCFSGIGIDRGRNFLPRRRRGIDTALAQQLLELGRAIGKRRVGRGREALRPAKLSADRVEQLAAIERIARQLVAAARELGEISRVDRGAEDALRCGVATPLGCDHAALLLVERGQQPALARLALVPGVAAHRSNIVARVIDAAALGDEFEQGRAEAFAFDVALQRVDDPV